MEKKVLDCLCTCFSDDEVEVCKSCCLSEEMLKAFKDRDLREIKRISKEVSLDKTYGNMDTYGSIVISGYYTGLKYLIKNERIRMDAWDNEGIKLAIISNDKRLREWFKIEENESVCEEYREYM